MFASLNQWGAVAGGREGGAIKGGRGKTGSKGREVEQRKKLKLNWKVSKERWTNGGGSDGTEGAE